VNPPCITHSDKAKRMDRTGRKKERGHSRLVEEAHHHTWAQSQDPKGTSWGSEVTGAHPGNKGRGVGNLIR
jgi:hypothetical protein